MSRRRLKYCCLVILILSILLVQSNVRSRTTLTSSGPTSSSTTPTTKESGPAQSQSEADNIQLRSPDYRVLYIVIPIAIVIFLMVLIYFLCLFSRRNSAQDYEPLNDDSEEGGSSSWFRRRGSQPFSSAVVDEIFDVPYTPHVFPDTPTPPPSV